MIKILSVAFLFITHLIICLTASGQLTYYVHSTSGSDTNNGTTPSSAWKTIQRINNQVLRPGDSILFARGQVFRGNLKANSGSESKAIVYASYGTGHKPQLLGSIQRNKSSDWKKVDENKWQTTGITLEDKPIDVGNIIFRNENDFGIKVPALNRVNKQGVFWSDTANRRVVLYSISNPAKYYGNLELALTRDVIKQTYTSYVVYRDLDLRYGAGHGIGGDSTHHILVQDVDISCMGGGYLYGFDTTRYGNGVEFYNAANNNIVERCRFSQIYDVAMTSQGDKPGHQVYNLIFKNNIVDKCEQSFELWLRGEGSSIKEVYFENNTTTNAGYGILHPQRPDTNGTFLLFWGFADDVSASDIYIRNNIFSNARNWGIYWYNPSDISKLTIDNNCWNIPSAPVARIRNNTSDAYLRVDDYRRRTGHDKNSIFKDPLLAKSTNALKRQSPCINTGLTIAHVKDDINGSLREKGHYDIGAFEYK